MAASYILISVAGYLTFAGDTNVLITANLLTQNGILSKTLIILVAAGCYFQTSPILAVMAEIPENDVFHFDSHSVWKIRAFRTVLFALICGISYLCIDHLPLIEAITGSMATMICSVICPALFYQKLVLDRICRSSKSVLSHDRQQIALGINSPLFTAATEASGWSHWQRVGMRTIIWVYVIVGTVIGIYLFSTDIVNAVSGTIDRDN